MKNTILTLILGALALPAAASAETVRLNFHSDRPVVESGKTETVLVKVEVRGDELPAADRPPVNLALVIDKSGSMGGDRIESARRGAIEAIRRLGRDDLFSVIVYDSEVGTLIPAQRLTDPERVERMISRIGADGRTNIYGGLEAGYAELEKNLHKKYLNRMVLLSDGLANVGPTHPDRFADLGRSYSRDGVMISTVGVGLDYNERLMSDLARAGEGNNYFVHHPRTLPKIFEEEIGNLVSTVARGVTLTIELPAEVQLRRVLGRHHRQDGDRLEIDFHDLAGGQTKYTVLELDVPAGTAGEDLEALRGQVAYRRANDNTAGEARGRSVIRYTESAEEAENATRHDVRDAWAELRQAEVQEEVLDLVADGRKDEAQDRLQRLGDEARGLGWAAAPARMDAYREREEAILEEREYDAEEVRSRRTEAYQLSTQQSTGRSAGSDGED